MYNHYVYFKHGVFNHLQTVLITLLSTLSLHELIVNVIPFNQEQNNVTLPSYLFDHSPSSNDVQLLPAARILYVIRYSYLQLQYLSQLM